MKKPLVSILIPVYNVEKYLKRCLDSVLMQTLIDIEVICVNDGSTDGSAKILEEYKKKDSRIKIITKENGGLPSARNSGLDFAVGKYIGFVDSDDFIEKSMFEKLVKTAESDGADVVICGANIFPETPEPEEWLKSCLTPSYNKYDNYSPELLYERVDTTPFLWRMLIRKDLIDSQKFRLDEDIIIGEDKAFQCKIFPNAKRITVIPDKLYNYYWCRPDSLMGKQVYGKFKRRVLAHAKLVCRIGCDIIKKNIEDKKSTQKAFLEWSIPFIYDDFIYLPVSEKILASQKLLPMWRENGYDRFYNQLPQWKKDAFEYIRKFEYAQAFEPRLTIVVPIEYTSRYVEQMLLQIENFLDNQTEVIIVNNGMSNDSYLKVQHLLHSNQVVRLQNMPKHASYAEALNMGIDLASGTYISFLDVQDWYCSNTQLKSWFAYAMQEAADICSSDYAMKKVPADTSVKVLRESSAEKKLFRLDYHNLLYKKSFLEKQKIEFSEASILTGFLFLCKTILSAEKMAYYEDNVYILREMHKPDWISTEKCEQVLEGLNELMDLSLEKRNSNLHGEIFTLLNGDKLKQILVNNTKPYCMPTCQCPNGENSQIKTVKTLLEIVGKANQKMLFEYGYTENDNLFETLYEVIRQRQIFLNDLSNEYTG